MGVSAKGLLLVLAAGVLLLACPLQAAPAPEPDGESRAPAEDRPAAEEKLVAAGLSAEEASARIAAMSPTEVAHLAHPDTEVRRGGDGLAILVALFIMIAVLYYVTDHEDRQHHEKR